jgi:hypothetical protein
VPRVRKTACTFRIFADVPVCDLHVGYVCVFVVVWGGVRVNCVCVCESVCSCACVVACVCCVRVCACKRS